MNHPGTAATERTTRRVLAAIAAAALTAALPAAAQAAAKTEPPAARALQIRADRVILQDVVQAGPRLLAVGERGIVLLSDDAGASWQPRFTPTNRTLSAVAMADAQNGLAVGHGGTVLATADGGNSWKAITVDAAGKDALLGVLHAGARRYVAWGAFGLYLESTDGGASWTRKQPLGQDFDRHISQVIVTEPRTAHPGSNSGTGNARSIGSTGSTGSAGSTGAAPAANPHWLLVGESGTLARSADAGATWEAVKSPYPGSYFGALATADGALLAFGMRGNIYRSADHGATWTKVESGTSLALMRGTRLQDGSLVLVGNAGLLAVSTDNGHSFTIGKTARGKGLAQLVQTRNILVAVGEAGAEQLTLKPAPAPASQKGTP